MSKKKRKRKRPSPKMVRERKTAEAIKYVAEALKVTKRTAKRELVQEAARQGGSFPINVYENHVELLPREAAPEKLKVRMSLYEQADAMAEDDPRRAELYERADQMR